MRDMFLFFLENVKDHNDVKSFAGSFNLTTKLNIIDILTFSPTKTQNDSHRAMLIMSITSGRMDIFDTINISCVDIVNISHVNILNNYHVNILRISPVRIQKWLLQVSC